MIRKLRDIRETIVLKLGQSVGQGEARAMASVILEDLLGITPVDYAVNPDRELNTESIDAINAIVERVVDGEPLQYVLGTTLFHGLRLKVGEGVLIPRPETSQLVDIVADKAGKHADLRVLDVCTGSGAIALALGRVLAFPRLSAVELSDKALSYARENFAKYNLKVSLVKSDVLVDELPEGPFDIIVSNPPYVDESERPGIDPRVLNHEPEEALFVPDEDPLLFYRAIATKAMDRLVDGGLLFFEINPHHSAELVSSVKKIGFDDVESLRDFCGRYRFLICKKPS